MTFVVVGAGPTGAEFSGALQELLRGPLRKDHPHLDLTKARIVLVEAGPRVLSVYPDRLSDYAARRLQRMGIELLLNTTVSKVDAAGVVLGDGSRIDAGTVLWTAGVGGPADLAEWHLETARGNRATVEPTLSLSGDAAVFVAGDAALPDGSFAPMVAQNASQQGTLAARNILRSISGEPLEPYTYRDLGNMAVIGRNAAVVHLFNKIAFTGYLAWIMWLGLHLIKLVGFRNRLAALVSWSGDYLFRDRVARLILPDGRSADEP
jgi:NADH dehydrogenase